MMAREFMSAPVETVRPETTVHQVARVLLDRRISALPVVDHAGALLGIVSASDLMERADMGTNWKDSWWNRFFRFDQELAEAYAKSHGVTAEHVMSRDVATVAPDAPLAEVVPLMARRGIHRVVVVEAGKPVGILSRSDVLRAVIAAEATAAATERDREIRARLLEELRGEPWFRLKESEVFVVDGWVTFTGLVGTPEERMALEVAARTIHGVKGVQNRTEVESELGLV